MSVRRFATATTRPISPHVQIYKFPLPAIVSIMNRATGVGLSVGIASVGLTCLVTDPTNLPGLIDGFKNAVPILVPVAKAIVAFPLVFHTVGGIRHLILDKTASGYSLQAFRASSLAVLAVAAVGTVFLASVTIEERQ